MAGRPTRFFYVLSILVFLNKSPSVDSNIDDVIDTGEDEGDERTLGPAGYMKREYSAIKPFVGKQYNNPTTNSNIVLNVFKFNSDPCKPAS